MNTTGYYQGKKVEVVRPAASGDVGWDPQRNDLVLIRFDEPGEEKTIPDQVVARADVKPT